MEEGLESCDEAIGCGEEETVHGVIAGEDEPFNVRSEGFLILGIHDVDGFTVGVAMIVIVGGGE